MTILKLSTASLLAGAILLSACTDVNTATNNAKQRTGEGAAVGAGAGALIGILGGDTKKERRQRAVVGAIVGGAAGALVGAQLDKQAADLQRQMSDGRVQIINTGSELIVRMPQDILFPVDSAVLQPTLRADLRALANNLQQYPNSTVFVYGHTDSDGSAAYNLQLSQQRAQAVSSVLVGHGVGAGRIRAIGKGEDEPIATNYTPQGKAQNRRVEIIIRPN